MKRVACVLVVVLCSAMFAFAQDNSKPGEMTGWVCNSKCVDQTTAKATCNKACAEASGEVVFINEDGRVMKIGNQDMAMPMSGKRVKMKATMDKDTGMLAVQNIIEYGG